MNVRTEIARINECIILFTNIM